MICRNGKGDICGKPAAFRLIASEGQLVPGCFMCRVHAEDVVQEYAEKLGEIWMLWDMKEERAVRVVEDSGFDPIALGM